MNHFKQRKRDSNKTLLDTYNSFYLGAGYCCCVRPLLFLFLFFIWFTVWKYLGIAWRSKCGQSGDSNLTSFNSTYAWFSAWNEQFCYCCLFRIFFEIFLRNRLRAHPLIIEFRHYYTDIGFFFFWMTQYRNV